ncbi:putative translation initiation factor 2, alpha subunit, nucleic acid-binding protein [Rosa chinensis]|uniref:Putative translation initiation factor 2, alpha subunit, nucleic acid-binding protein n=1 Tax=Rosa chinensis TaxID=74649 RepID=A0A2P6RAH8_ROSCH|nr:eukaryotic translation initiation factor 2 subunit alpha homolog [Rosa chinensis]PRQ43427.1 putative translation initiation factor 2, alpha subunit, nucleic acid-binding protein [Rosa chinensis]
MASNTPNLECRMYEAKYPEIDAAVMIQVNRIDHMGAYVSLLEYNNMEGMIPLTELSNRRLRSINKHVKVGRIEPVLVYKVDEHKGYIDLSKRRLSHEDIQACDEKYNKSKLVHSIMRHVAETLNIDLEELYVNIAWPLYRKYGHAAEAFKIIATDSDSVLDSLTPTVSEEVKECLLKNIKRRMPVQPLKIRADIEVTCYHFDGVLHIKDALRKAEAAGNDECPVKVKLIAPPRYVVTTQTLDKKQGISVLSEAIETCREAMEHHKGKLVVKEAPRVVSEVEDKMHTDQQKNAEVMSSDDEGEEEEEEDTGLGDVDVENAGQGIIVD